MTAPARDPRTDPRPGIDHLKALSDRLATLLAYPWPGLFTWRATLHEVIKEIAEYAQD